MARGIVLLISLILLGILCAMVIPTIYFANQNAVDNNITVTGPDSGAFEYFKTMGDNIGIWIGSLGPMTAYLIIAFAAIIVVMLAFYKIRSGA
jgi:hypothetical protein